MPPQSKVVHPMVSVPDALRTVLTETARRLSTLKPHEEECLPVTGALLGRTLARPVYQQSPGYPPYRASIMDGYAIHTRSLEEKKTDNPNWTHVIVDKVHAGDDLGDNERNKEAVDAAAALNTSDSLPPAHYITTGAVVPDEYDQVVPVEDCRVDPENALLQISKLPKTSWIRAPGCDMPAHELVLPAGQVLDGISYGLLLQSGVSEVHVVVKASSPKISVGVLSTGNELLLEDHHQENTAAAAAAAAAAASTYSWKNAQKGCIPDVNRPILLDLVQSWFPASSANAVQTKDLGICRDEHAAEHLTKILQTASKTCNVLITTGGISMGEMDLVEQLLVEQLHAKLHFGRLHMKPGKPTTFFTLPNGCLVFCLPGNPVSATVCCHLLVRPCLQLLTAGPQQPTDQVIQNARVHTEVPALLTHDCQLDTQRPEYARVLLEYSVGNFYATTTGVQRSSRLASLQHAQGLLLLPQGTRDKPTARKGETYTVLLLSAEAGVLFPTVTVATSRHLNPQQQQQQQQNTHHHHHDNHHDHHSHHHDHHLQSRGIRTVNLISWQSPLPEVSELAAALNGSHQDDTSMLQVPMQQAYQGTAQGLVSEITSTEKVACDVTIILSSAPWPQHTTAANLLRPLLSKPADALALQMRQAAAKADPQAALYEVVVGVWNRNANDDDDDKTLVILASIRGWKNGLRDVRGLMAHAVQLLRDC